MLRSCIRKLRDPGIKDARSLLSCKMQGTPTWKASTEGSYPRETSYRNATYPYSHVSRRISRRLPPNPSPLGSSEKRIKVKTRFVFRLQVTGQLSITLFSPSPSRWCLVDGDAGLEAQQLLGPGGLLPAVVVRQLAGGPHLTQGGCALEAL